MQLTWGQREVLRYALRHEGRTRITHAGMAETLVRAGTVTPTEIEGVYEITPVGRLLVRRDVSRIYMRLLRFVRAGAYELVRLRDGREEFVLWPATNEDRPYRMARGASRCVRKRWLQPVGVSDVGDVYGLTERGEAILDKAASMEKSSWQRPTE